MNQSIFILLTIHFIDNFKQFSGLVNKFVLSRVLYAQLIKYTQNSMIPPHIQHQDASLNMHKLCRLIFGVYIYLTRPNIFT